MSARLYSFFFQVVFFYLPHRPTAVSTTDNLIPLSLSSSSSRSLSTLVHSAVDRHPESEIHVCRPTSSITFSSLRD
ncbi:hypothetical protein VTJ04DRAFT_219 [Mycothermus thermophilus]|uniref:uncharacterized protein n=1 Tax=Humicola insolens TaxID=85995 RepID=UPI003742FFFF